MPGPERPNPRRAPLIRVTKCSICGGGVEVRRVRWPGTWSKFTDILMCRTCDAAKCSACGAYNPKPGATVCDKCGATLPMKHEGGVFE